MLLTAMPYKFQSWTKLRTGDVTEEVAWPVGRDGHASCLLSGSPNPQVLISGGWDKDNKLINDAWILNINARVWKEVSKRNSKLYIEEPLEVGEPFQLPCPLYSLEPGSHPHMTFYFCVLAKECESLVHFDHMLDVV